MKILNGEEAFSESLKSKIFSVNPVNKLFDKKLFEGERFPERKISEDAFIIPSILLKAKKVVCKADIKYYYVRHENSITTSNFFDKDSYGTIEVKEEKKLLIIKEETEEKIEFELNGFKIKIEIKLLKEFIRGLTND